MVIRTKRNGRLATSRQRNVGIRFGFRGVARRALRPPSGPRSTAPLFFRLATELWEQLVRDVALPHVPSGARMRARRGRCDGGWIQGAAAVNVWPT